MIHLRQMMLVLIIDLRKRFSYNQLIGPNNINYLKEKVIPLREVLSNVSIDVLCVDETILDSSFPDLQFKIEDTTFHHSGEIET